MHNKTLIKSAVSLYALQFAKYVFPFITIPYLTRVLGTEAYGIRVYVLSVMSSVQLIADFGFTNYGIYRMVVASDNADEQRRVNTSILESKVILLSLLAFGVFCLSMVTPILLDNSIYVIIAFIAVALTALLPDYVFRSYEKMEVLTKRFIVCKSISTVLTFLLIHSDADLLIVPLLDAISALIAALWSWKIVIFDYKLYLMSVKLFEVLYALKESAVYFASGAASVIFTSATTFMLGIYNGNLTEIAYWGLAGTVLSAADALCGPLTNALYPNLMKSDSRALPGFFNRMLKSTAPLIAVIFILMIVFRNQIVLLLGGEEYLPGAYIIALMSPVVVTTFYTSVLGWPALGATGHVRELTMTTLVAAGFHALSLVLLAFFTNYELVYVALARIASSIILLVLRVYQCKRIHII